MQQRRLRIKKRRPPKQSLLMQLPTTPSTSITITSKKQKTHTENYSQEWIKKLPSRFPLKIFRFVYKKHQPLPLTVPHPLQSNNTIPQGISTLSSPEAETDKVQKIDPVQPVCTPIRRRTKRMTATCSKSKEKGCSQCQEYQPEVPKTPKRKHTLRKKKTKGKAKSQTNKGRKQMKIIQAK